MGSRQTDHLCLTQVPKARVSGLPTTTFAGKRFQLWALGFFCTERHLAKRLKSNQFYPFTQQQPGGARGGPGPGVGSRAGPLRGRTRPGMWRALPRPSSLSPSPAAAILMH